ncbi:MAG: PAS domain S-box protein [Halobacteriaceae archaeon]
MLLKRTLGLGYLTGVALLIGSMSFLHLMEPGEPFLGRILSFVALIGLSGPLLWSVYWLKSQEFTADRIWRTVRWSLVGLVAITLLASITVFYERSHGVFLADVTMIMLWIAGTGATAGIIIGWYNLQYQLQIEKVRQTATHLSTVVETLPVALIEIDQAGAVTRWNPTAEQIFGWNEEDIRDQRLPIIPEDSEQCKEWREIIENEESVVAKELHCRGKSDIQITARLWTAPLEDTEGDIVGTILVITDVTDKAQRRQRLEVINRILRHNLRNKLTVIQGNTSLLQKKISDSDLQSKITTIINSTQRLARLSKEAQDIHNALTTDTASQQAYDIVSLIDRIQNEF